jgi:hypothetical protein
LSLLATRRSASTADFSTSSFTCASNFCISLTLSHRSEPWVFSLHHRTAISLLMTFCSVSRFFLPLLRVKRSQNCLYLLMVSS